MRRRGGRDGFTLIETLVAFFVIAVVMAVTARGLVVARLGLDRAQSTIAAEAVARSILETELDRIVVAPGVFTGSTDGIGWTVAAEPLDLPLPAPPPVQNGPAAGRPSPDGSEVGDGSEEGRTGPAAKWAALRVLVSVANGRGKPLTVETIHLVRADRQ